MRWLRRLGITVLVLVVLGIVARFTMPYWVPYLAQYFEPWIRKELMAVIGDYLVPTVTIEKIDYQWPLTVSASGVTMTAENPTTGKPVKIFSVDKMQIELKEIPWPGDPLIFQNFQLDSPTLVVDVLEDGTVIGWENFLKDISDAPDDRKPSEIFAIHNINVDKFKFEYAVEGYDDRMVLDDLDFSLDNRGKSEGEDKDLKLPQGGAWYAIDTEIVRDDLFSIKLAGAFNIDTLNVTVEKLKIDIAISEDSIPLLPPRVQEQAKKYNLEGHLDLLATGKFDIDDIASTVSEFYVELSPSHFAFKDRLINIDSASIDLLLKDQILSTDNGTISVFDGILNFTFMLEQADPEDIRALPENTEQAKKLSKELTGYLPESTTKIVSEKAKQLELTMHLNPVDIKLQNIHRVDVEQANYYGTVNGDVDLNSNLGNFSKSLLGAGDVSITDGKFNRNEIMKTLAGVMSVALLGLGDNDRASAIFSIEDEKISFSSLTILASPIGVRGSGWVGFDETLRLSVNAGPLEAVEESSGVGRVLGVFTDAILKYIITGNTERPRITVAPLGIGS